MKKIKENGIRNIVHTNICIIIMILVVLILTIVYKFITYKNEIQAPLETSVNLEELYNTTKTEEADINEEENKKDVNSNISDWELLLVNKNHKIPDDYIVALEEIETTHKVDKRIASSLEEMLNEARKQGLSPIICSSYRTNAKQKQLYNDKIKEYRRLGYNRTKAEELASYWIAIPGTGEHETGLAVDIVSTPTGPPLNLFIKASKYSMSIASSPYLSTLRRSRDSKVISKSILPSPLTKAKSLTLLNKRLAILGVFLLLLASSTAASSSIFILRTRLVLLTILASSSSE